MRYMDLRFTEYELSQARHRGGGERLLYGVAVVHHTSFLGTASAARLQRSECYRRETVPHHSYTADVLRCAITDSRASRDQAVTDPLSSAQQDDALSLRRQHLLAQTKRLAEKGVDYIQLREKDLDAGELLALAEEMISALRGSETKVLINARADVAVAANAHGVHLTSHPDELSPDQVRQVFAIAHAATPLVSTSCHTIEEVERAHAGSVDLILFGPIFEKREAGEVVVAGVGLDVLRRACKAAKGTALIALGGITEANTEACIGAGAGGVAGIRLFQ